jgi:hypothetical protein
MSMSQIEAVVHRRVFPSWSVDIPETFSETIAEEGYWHAYGGGRSVSITSIVVHDKDGPVPARQLAAELMAIQGAPIAERPLGLGHAAVHEERRDGKLTQVFQGLLAVTGTILLITITGGDLPWAMRTWLSLEHHGRGPKEGSSRRRRSARDSSRGPRTRRVVRPSRR